MRVTWCGSGDGDVGLDEADVVQRQRQLRPYLPSLVVQRSERILVVETSVLAAHKLPLVGWVGEEQNAAMTDHQVRLGGTDASVARDDAVLPVTHWMAVLIVPVLVAAFVIMYLLPTRTEALWAWTVQPPVTATTMGGSYLAGAWFFLRVARADRWHTIGSGLPATTAFTTLLLVATVLHWDRFNHDHVSFWAWLALYVITPPLLPLVWWRNRLRDPGVAASEHDLLPGRVRMVAAAGGAVLLGLALAAFVFPATAIAAWPWTLTPLTARTTAAFASFPAIVLLTFAWEARWSALRIPVEACALGLGLTAVGVVVHRGDVAAGPGAAVHLALLGGTAAGLTGLLWARRAAVGRGRA